MRSDTGADAVSVLDRITAIFEAFDEDDRGLRISHLALRADLPKSTVSRLVSTLVSQRYLERDGDVIHLGIRLFELGQLAAEPRELRSSASPIMADLRSETGHSVYLAIRDAHEMVCISIMRGHAAAPIPVRIGGRLPAHATALGKAILAYADAEDAEAVIAAGLTSWTPRTIIEREPLLRQLARARQSGFAVETAEFADGVSSVASPVFSGTGRPVASISVTGDSGALDADRLASPVRTAALALTRRLAAGGPWPGASAPA